MKIAAAAFPIDWHNRWNEYVGKLRLWVRTAAEQGADLLVFPEYAALELASLAGEANAADPRKAIDAVSARIKDVDDLHGSLAREFKVHICAASGPMRRKDGTAVNRARLFAPDGSHGGQEKLVLTEVERERWGLVAGEAGRVFETALGPVGILLNYDAEFPLVARAMAEAGAEVLLVPACTDTQRGYWRVRAAAMARALENQCVVVQAVTVGEADWLPGARRSHGAAGVFGPADVGFPEDGVIALGKADTAGWVYGEIGIEAVRQVRAEGAVRPFRDWPGRADLAVGAVPLGLGAPESS